MRTIGVILTISIILASLSIAEEMIIKNFCNDIEKSVSDAADKFESGAFDIKDIDKIKNVWTKHKTMILIFANHNMFKDYEDCISEMYYYYDSDEKDELYFNYYNLSEINKRMKESMHFNVGNIF